MKRRRAVGYHIAVYALMLLMFSASWALFYWGLYPQVQSWQQTYYSGAIDSATTAGFTALVTGFPLIMVFGGAFWVINEAQRKESPGDFPG